MGFSHKTDRVAIAELDVSKTTRSHGSRDETKDETNEVTDIDRQKPNQSQFLYAVLLNEVHSIRTQPDTHDA